MALEYRSIPYTAIAVNLLNGETESEEHLNRSPAGFVPVLEIGSTYLTESLAMIQYLDETYPGGHLLGKNPVERAKIWALAEVINAGTQPLQNMPVLDYFSDPMEKKKWAQRWIANGLQTFEQYLKRYSLPQPQFCIGSSLTLADLCLVPQVYNAVRYEVSLDDLPLIQRIHAHLITLPCAQASHPDRFKPADATS
jgi:maleylacetoacetate isomerase